MSTLGQKPATQHVSTEKQSITGNGGTSYTLQQSVSQASDIEVFVNNTRQEPTVAYTASGTTLTMTGAVNSSDSFYVIFQGKAIQTAGLPVDAAITASTVTTSQTITSTGNITTSSTVNTPSINGGQIGGRRNIIINGAMQVFQRATSATTATTSYNTADRFRADTSTDGAFTTEKSTDNPFGTGSSLKAQVTTADTSLAATQYARILQNIEAQNVQHLLYGTSSAKTIALSFWVKSNKTGIYSIVLRKTDNTAYHFTHEYTISSANIWEQKKIIITPTAGSTSFITASAGAIDNDNGLGFELSFALGQGSTYAIGTSNTWSSNTSTFASSNQVNWLDSTSNSFYLTQVQLEVGEQATEFEHRSFGEELALCQRYFAKSYNHSVTPGTAPDFVGCPGRFVDATSSFASVQVFLPVTMRATPTVTLFNPSTGATASIRSDSANHAAAATHIGETGFFFYANNSSISTSQSIRGHYTAEAEI